MKRLRLAEFIEVLVPTRDRHRRALSSRRQREWNQEAVAYETREGLTILSL